MKKTLFFFGALLLLINLSSIQVLADSVDVNEEELDQEFEEILKDIPEGEYNPDNDESDIKTNATRNQYIPKGGDILYTPSTQCDGSDNCKGISGHVGIVGPSGANIVHSSGKGATPTLITKNTWFDSYAKTIVIRPNNSSKGKEAAIWAKYYYGPFGAGADKPYKITFEGDLTQSLSTKTTYCSLVVWQAYYFGADQFLSVGDPIHPKAFVNFASYHGMTNYMKIGY